MARSLRALASPDSLVVDLRGMRDRPFEVCLGTGPRPDARILRVVEAVMTMCEHRGLTAAVNEPFGALPSWTVTHHAQTVLGLVAVEVQLAASLCSPLREPFRAQLALGILRAAAAAAVS